MRQRMGRHRFLAEADPLADHQRADERGDAGVDVHHRAAGEVERAPLEGEAGVGVHGSQCRFGSLLLGGIGAGVGDGLGGADDGFGAGPVPDHVRHREIDERHPQRDEERDRRELHALGHRPDDQRRRDAGKRHLEADVDVLGDDDALGEGLDVRFRRDAGQEGLAEAAEVGCCRSSPSVKAML